MRTSLAVLGLLAAGCGTAAIDDLTDGAMLLPKHLREVSGLAVVDANTVACVQDEVGAVFLVDLSGHHEPRAEVFGPRGDYEGLALVGEQFWVLRSDGMLLRLDRAAGALHIAASVRLPAAHAEWEGLCYDADRRLLLAMPKDRAKNGMEHHLRPIFAVDPVAGRLLPEPAIVLDMRTLEDQAAARGIDLPTKKSGRGKRRLDLQVNCSDLLVLPGKDRLLVLSGADRALLAIDREGRLVGYRALDAGELPQPEGLALLPDGRLLVASEGSSHGILRVVPLP